MSLNVSSLKRGLLAMFDCVSDCVWSVEATLLHPQKPALWPEQQESVPDGAKRHKNNSARYSIRLEYKSPGGQVARSTGDTLETTSDEGGFDLKLPPNRFRTRSIAIVAGYSPERLYSNMPPGAFVVESGVYKVGADRDWVKSEPIYWKQVVYGSRNGSDGSGTYPRGVAISSEDRNKLQALAPNLKDRRVVRSRLTPDNLEIESSPGGPKLRASSPLEQGQPLIDWMSPGNNYSDISSVPHPSSAERSFPSTLLTNPLSSISSGLMASLGSSPGTFSMEHSSSRSRGQPSLRTIPEDGSVLNESLSGRVSVRADIHASQYSSLADYRSGAETPVSRRMRSQPTTDMVGYPSRDWTVGVTNISFPGHQVSLAPYSYPAPTHRAISPSKQYPAYPLDPNQEAPHIQPPQIPDIRIGGVDPKEVDIYQRIAQLDPENTKQATVVQRPLATSSPPRKRKLDEQELGPLSIRKPRYPTPPGPRPNQSTSPRSDQRPGSQTGSSHTGGEGSVTDSHPIQQSRGKKSSHHSTKSSIPKTRAERESRSRPEADAVSVVSEGLDAEVTAITSSSSPGSSGSNTLQPTYNRDRLSQVVDQVRSRHSTPSSPLPPTSPFSVSFPSEKDRSSSGIGSKNTSQNATSSSHSTSGGSATLQQTSLSPKGISSPFDLSKHIITEEKSAEDPMPFYENWPPRPFQYAAPPGKPAPPQHVAYSLSTYMPTITSGVPPFTPHTTQGMLAKPQQSRGRERRLASSPAGDLDSSADTPPSRGSGPASRPNSSQSAPLDRSVDRHYEWDAATVDDNTLAALPREWAATRQYPAYNPRRDRDMGGTTLRDLTSRERVFSDSEIYSNVFPRGRLVQFSRPLEDEGARVNALKKEFNEYRRTQNKSPTSDSDRLESLI